MMFDPNPWLPPPPPPEAYNYGSIIFLSVLLVCFTIVAVAWLKGR